ncbi:2-iminobutanoate/2-iminopropanoate deaminase [Leucobacter luti]|uniref:RidA family protein n=1 Tax=Leucobacter luti TaxID=340320 RepID=UPI0010F0225E|nr:RidA family protein [Leucobacter luti]MCW2288932.1 2-iminobutanoate/2-iminopropanoate deaminase [Leucobacter luti]TCK44918.1 2-iminobutanoate/2-iminopropanoate deaminase [Leucobacter luti]
MSAVLRVPEPTAGALSADVTVIGETAYVTVIPVDDSGVLAEGIEAQSELVIDSLETELERVGAGLGDIAHLTIYLRDLSTTRAIFNEVYARRFGAAVPVRCAVGVAELARPSMLVELTAIAAVPAAA